MTTFNEIWPKLQSGKEYRDAFVAQQAKQAIGFQIQALLKQTGWTQTELATRSGLSQGVISRAADPTYGNLTLNTCVRIAAGFDVAFIGRYVPFSELPRWFDRIYSDEFTVASFADENSMMEALAATRASLSQHGAPSETSLDNLYFWPRKGPKSAPWEQKKPDKSEVDERKRKLKDTLANLSRAGEMTDVGR